MAATTYPDKFREPLEIFINYIQNEIIQFSNNTVLKDLENKLSIWNTSKK